MTQEVKIQKLNELRHAYHEFVKNVTSITMNPVQAQQGIYRLEEAHMWFQNGILSVEEQPALPETQDESAKD